jgi:hypothetical protein
MQILGGGFLFGGDEIHEEMRRGGADGHGSAVVENEVGPRWEQVGVGNSGAEGDDTHARGLARADASGNVFDDDAFRRRKSEMLRGFEIRLRMRLAMGDIGSGEENSGQRKSGGANADFGEIART